MPTNLQQLLQNIPPPPEEDLLSQIRQKVEERSQTIVVLDDDPTGTQTVYDVPVLTEWSTEVIRAEFERETSLFYILTNSRSMPVREANQLAATIGQNLTEASQQTGRGFFVISRSDSTLRGHYPDEVDALLAGMQQTDAVRILIPAFLEGGRYTINDTHYVQEGDDLIPVGETPFAQDKSFGFHASNLKKWVAEKTDGQVKSDEVISLSLSNLRRKGAEYVTNVLSACSPNATCVVNAAHRYDLEAFALGLLNAEVPVICRTAASVVPVIAGLNPKDLLTGTDLLPKNTNNGGLVIVGSYVPKSTTQLEHLLENTAVQSVEIDVAEILATSDTAELSETITSRIEEFLAAGKDTVVYTSRKLISGQDKEESLKIGQQVSTFMTNVIRQVNVPPRYLLAKGGITSSDTATQGLNVKRATVLGQVLPGVPVWKLGEESKFPRLTYIVFPGNVGEVDSISTVINNLKNH